MRKPSKSLKIFRSYLNPLGWIGLAGLFLAGPGHAQNTARQLPLTGMQKFGQEALNVQLTSKDNLTSPISYIAPVSRVITSVKPSHLRSMAAISSTATGGNWSAPGTWVGGVVPTAADDVTIVGGATVTLDVNASALSLTIVPTGSLVTSATTNFRLEVGGNVTNNGTLDLSNSATIGSDLRFVGAGNATFSGTGTTDLHTMSLAKAVRADIVEMNLPTLSVKGSTTSGDGFLFTRTTGATPADDMVGTLKISGTATISNKVFGNAAAYIIPATGGFWLNNPNFTVVAQTGTATVSGLLQITAGTYNVGTAAGNSILFGSNSILTMEGGTLNAAGRVGSFTSATAAAGMTLNMSGGVINVATVGNAAATPSFGIAGTILWSGGTVNLVQRSTSSTPLDYYTAGITGFPASSYTGGTLNVGTAATATNFDFRIRGSLPNLTIDNTGTGKTVLLAAQTNPFGTVLINSGATLNLNGFLLLQIGPNITNNGTFTGNTTGSRLYFQGNVAQSIGGTGTFTSPIAQVTFQNSSTGVTINAPITTRNVAMFRGNVTNSANLTILADATTLGVLSFGLNAPTSPAGSFDVSPTFNVSASGLYLIYNPETAPRTTGTEIPPNRTVYFLDINNPQGVTLAGGNLTVSGASSATASAFSLVSGILTTSPTSTLIVGPASPVLPAGSATSYVNGPMGVTVNSSTAVSRIFAVGDAAGWRPVVIGGITTTSAQTFTTTVINGATGGSASGPISSLNPTRYVRIENTANLPATATVQLSYGTGDVIGNPATAVIAQAPTANGVYASIGGAPVTTPTTGIVSTQNIVPGNEFFVIANTEGGTLATSVTAVCAGTNTGTITLTGLATGATITGYEANTGSGFTAVSGTNTTPTYTFTNLTTTTTFRAVIQTSDARTVYSAPVAVTVNPATTATFNYGTSSTFCQSAAAVSPTVTGTAGGTFASTSGLTINATTGEITPATSTPGTYTVTYSVAGPCPSSETQSVTISPASSAAFAYSGTTFCLSGTNPSPTITGATGGTFSAPTGLSINASTGLINLASTTPGTYTVTYTTSGACPASSTASVTVASAPSATFNYATTSFCQGSTATPTPTFPTGSSAGTFSSTTGLSINATTGAINLATSTPGTYTVTNSIAASGGCSAATATTSVTITPSTTATFTFGTGGNSFCRSGAVVTPTVTGTTGGTFASTTGLTINATTGAITPTTSTAGTYTVTYSVGGACPSTGTQTITIAAPAVATFSYATSTLCTSATTPVAATLGTGSTAGTFTAPAGLTINATTGAVTPSTSTPGTYTVTNTIPASGGCAAVTATSQVIINAAPVAAFSYPAAGLCTSATTPVAATLGTGSTAGTFSSTAGLTINATTGAITPSTSTPGTYTITNTIPAAGGCAAVTATSQVTITAPATATFSYPSTTICSSATSPATPTLGTGSVAGTFSSTTGLTIDATTGEVTPSTSTPGVYTVTNTIAASGGCAAVTATAQLTITAAPATPTVTQNGGTLTSSAATGNQWFLNGTAIPGATGQTYVTTANGAYTVVSTVGGCPSAASAVQNVTNTGLGDALAGMSVKVYPNPAKGNFNVKLTGYQKDATVVLYNLAGQQITTEVIRANQGEKQVSVKGLAAGVYMLKVTSDKGVQVTRLVVE